MQWDIVVVVILVIGICVAVIEARQKRVARKDECKGAGTEQYAAKKASKKQGR